MDTIRATAAAVIGARHLKAARNGQDAAAVWTSPDAGAVVVCDGCGSGASSEVGARLGARLVIASLARRLEAGGAPADRELWHGVRADVIGRLEDLVAAAACDSRERAAFVEEYLLFTIVAAAANGGDSAAVWAIGDGAYAIARPSELDRAPARSVIDGLSRELGPFADNQPPYLAYDLLGMPQDAVLEPVSAAEPGAIIVATDGAAELGLDAFAIERCLAHPDALRRRLAIAARSGETIEWGTRRVVRAPAALQDDGAVAILAWRGRPS